VRILILIVEEILIKRKLFRVFWPFNLWLCCDWKDDIQGASFNIWLSQMRMKQQRLTLFQGNP